MNASPADAADSRRRFLAAMSRAACTVTVVTTDGPAGRAGVTVSAMASVSADTPKPTLLVCVHHLSPAARAIIDNGVFCVNLLREEQQDVADCLAGRLKPADGDKFSLGEWAKDVNGAPLIIDSLAAFSCRVMSAALVGTHHVLFGAVENIVAFAPGLPLIHVNRGYARPVPIEAALSRQAA